MVRFNNVTHSRLLIYTYFLESSTSEQDLGDSLGGFGVYHWDTGDSTVGYTAMLSAPSMPDTYRTGHFDFAECGAAVEVTKTPLFSGFQGLRRHGGTAPTAPPGHLVEEWAYRFVCVLYPPSVVFENQAVSVIASLDSHIQDEDVSLHGNSEEHREVSSQGNHRLFKLSPEMKNKLSQSKSCYTLRY